MGRAAVAESTGKHGRGILPVADEPLRRPGRLRRRPRVRLPARQRRPRRRHSTRAIAALGDAGHPTLTLRTNGREDLGRIFFLAEFATAVAGWVLEINPFDQPNVQEAKDATKRVLAAGLAARSCAVADDDALRALLIDAGPPHYIAIMGYVRAVGSSSTRRSPSCARRFAGRPAPRRRSATARASCTRPVSSTRAGRRSGASCQLIVDEPQRDAEIPGAGYSFGTLKTAQALGDLQTLRSHGLPAQRVVRSGATRSRPHVR